MGRKILRLFFEFVHHYYEISQQMQLSSGEYFLSDSHLNANIRDVFFTVTLQTNSIKMRYENAPLRARTDRWFDRWFSFCYRYVHCIFLSSDRRSSTAWLRRGRAILTSDHVCIFARIQCVDINNEWSRRAYALCRPLKIHAYIIFLSIILILRCTLSVRISIHILVYSYVLCFTFTARHFW